MWCVQGLESIDTSMCVGGRYNNHLNAIYRERKAIDFH